MSPDVSSASAAAKRYWWILDPAILAIVVGTAFRKHIFGSAVFPWDFQGRMTAGPTYVASSISSGNWPSWNPYQGSGEPMATNIGAGIYYPAHWLAGLLRIPLTLRAQALLQVLHVWGGAVGALLLARALGLRRLPALMMGVTYALWGGFYGQASHMHHVRGFALIPWLLWAVTPTDRGLNHRRLALLPVLFYLLASGGYPGQLVPFVIAVAVYGLVALIKQRRLDRPTIITGAIAAVGSLAAIAIVILPFMLAQGELFRAVEPTPRNLSKNAFGLEDIGRLYLNYDQTIVMSTWIAAPVLVGIAFVRRRTITVIGPLLAAGLASAVILALTHAPFFPWLFEDTPFAVLYPSRFPGSDHKAVISLAIIAAGVAGWQRFTDGGPPRRAVASCAAAVVLLLAGSYVRWGGGSAQTHARLLLVVTLVAALGLAWWYVMSPTAARLGGASTSAVLMLCLTALVLVDGTRLQSDGRRDKLPENAWTSIIDLDERYGWETGLADQLRDARVSTRPPREIPIETERPQGVPQETVGFLIPEYRMGSYGGHTVQARVDAYEDQALFDFLAGPSQVRIMRCTGDPDCPAAVDIAVDFDSTEPTDDVQLVSYGAERLVYRVDLQGDPVLMVENEIPFSGWQVGEGSGHVLDHDSGPLRTWILMPGQYQFSLVYRWPYGIHQQLAALLSLASILWLWRRLERPESAAIAAPSTESSDDRDRQPSQDR